MEDKQALDLSEAYKWSVSETLQALQVDSRQGLASREAEHRLSVYGENSLPKEKVTPAWRRLLSQFQNGLVILLIVAGIFSAFVWAYEREHALPYEALAIFAIVLLNAILGYVQEARAEEAVAKLREMTTPWVTVLRDGVTQNIQSERLVPGDMILLEQGDKIPADARLVETIALQTVEAPLTGESMPVIKKIDAIPQDAIVSARENMVFSGTIVAYGRAVAVVTATGMKAEIGRIADMLSTTADQTTPLQRQLDRTGKLLGVLVIFIAIGMVILLIGVHQVPLDSLSELAEILIFGVALAVAAVPEGLPAIVTVVLALGVQRMAARKAIVRRLSAVEALGSANVIASDKTGTLTKNEMTVRKLVTAKGELELEGTGYAPEGAIVQKGSSDVSADLMRDALEVFKAGARANNSRLEREDGKWAIHGDPTEAALLVAARKAGIYEEHLAFELNRVEEVPFSAERKLMSVVDESVDDDGELVIYSKGAPDELLRRCSHELFDGEPRTLSEERREELRRVVDEMASEALRTLALAFRKVRRLPDGSIPGEEKLENDLILLGMVGMIDPPRPEALEAVQRARHAGVRPIMITGDHPKTALVIAQELGIAENDKVLMGEELARYSEEQLNGAIEDVRVYARVAPEHKLHIVKALQRSGAVVAMTGDGVNDAPALKTADIGVAMGITGTDVSKEASDMVLLDDNFATIVVAIEEGRSIYSNIQKFLRYLLSSNTGEVLTLFLAVLFAGFFGFVADDGVVLPLLATQILWINLVTDGAPALALGMDPPDPDLMDEKPRSRNEAVLTRSAWFGILFVGAVMAAGTLFVLDANLPGGRIGAEGDIAYGRTAAFNTLVLFQLFNAFNARSDEHSALANLFSNGLLWLAIGLSLLLQVAVIHVGFLQLAFSTVPLTFETWVLCILVASSVLWLRELTKLIARWIYRARSSGMIDAVQRS